MKKSHKTASPERRRKWLPRGFNSATLYRHAGSFVLCLLLAVAFFHPFVIGQRSFLWDTQEFGFPYLNMVTRTLSQTGHLPLWNMYNFSGYSFAGDIESGMFSPVTWLFALLFGGIQFPQLAYFFIFNFTLGGFFAYLLCYRLTKNYFAAIAGAVAFAFSGYAMGHISHLGQDTLYQWIPAVVLAFQYSFEKRSNFTTLLAGLTLGLALLVGHPNTSLYLMYFLAAFILVTAISTKKKWKEMLIRGIVSITFGFLIAAVMILPVADLTLKSNRLALTYDQQSQHFSLNPADLWGMVSPNQHHILEKNALAVFNGSVDITQNYLYIGILPLIAILFAIGFSFYKRDWRVWFFAGMAFLAVLLGFGNNTPLNWIFFNVMPGFNKVRMAVQIMSIFFFTMAILSAFGFAKILELVKGKKRDFAALILGIALVTVVIFDIFSHGYGKSFYSDPVAPRQIYNSQQEQTFMERFTHAMHELFRIQDEMVTVTPNKWMYYGIENVWGNGGIKLKLYDKLFNKTSRMSRTAITDRLLDFLNVKYLITDRAVDPKHFQKISEFQYQNFQVLPRAYWVSEAIVEPDLQKQFLTMQNDQIDYATQVLLTEKPVYVGSTTAPATSNNVTILKHDDQRLLINASTTHDAILVLSEPDDGSWVLRVDGKRENYLTANTVFRAVPLKAGVHQVEFTYHSKTVFWGMLLSIGGLCMFLVVGVLEFRKRK